jgi:MFS family permease
MARMRPLILLASTVFVDLVGFGIVIPNLPRYVINASHVDAQHAAFIGGLLAASYSFAQFLFAPLWGAISDRVGRRPIILLSQIGYAASFLLFGLAGQRLWMLFAARLLAGVLSSASIGVAFAYVADVTPPEKRAMGIGILGACFGLGFMVGPGIGGYLSGFGLAVPAFAAAGVSFVNFLITSRRLPESLPAADREKAKETPIRFRPFAAFWVFRTPIWYLFVLTFTVTLGFTAVEQTVGYYLLAVPSFHITPDEQPKYSGVILAFAGLIGIVIQGGLIGRLTTRFGEGVIARVGIAIMVAGFATFAFPHTLVGLVLGPMLLLAAGRSMTAPALSSLTSRKTAHGQGLTLSTSQSFDSLARTVGPMSAGMLFQYVAPAAPYLVSMVVMACALIIAVAHRAGMVAPAGPPDGGSGIEGPAVSETGQVGEVPIGALGA